MTLSLENPDGPKRSWSFKIEFIKKLVDSLQVTVFFYNLHFIPIWRKSPIRLSWRKLRLYVLDLKTPRASFFKGGTFFAPLTSTFL